MRTLSAGQTTEYVRGYSSKFDASTEDFTFGMIGAGNER